MRRSFVLWQFLCTCSLGLSAVGCSSDPNASTQDASGVFDGSCTTSNSTGWTFCWEDYKNSPAWMQQQCLVSNTDLVTAVYSTDHCSTSGLGGKCTPPWGWVQFYYLRGESSLIAVSDSCRSSGGTWSTPP